jgi:hypothetical protein
MACPAPLGGTYPKRLGSAILFWSGVRPALVNAFKVRVNPNQRPYLPGPTESRGRFRRPLTFLCGCATITKGGTPAAGPNSPEVRV